MGKLTLTKHKARKLAALLPEANEPKAEPKKPVEKPELKKPPEKSDAKNPPKPAKGRASDGK